MLQVIITIFVLVNMKTLLPDKALITPWPVVDFAITLFLVTYCADMLALLISSFARTTTAAMTIMPFLLIVQLLFSGFFLICPKRLRRLPI